MMNEMARLYSLKTILLYSAGLMDTSRSAFLTPAMLKQFIATHQMESVDENYAARLIQVRLGNFFLFRLFWEGGSRGIIIFLTW